MRYAFIFQLDQLYKTFCKKDLLSSVLRNGCVSLRRRYADELEKHL